MESLEDAKRFYPAYLPTFRYEPSRDDFDIRYIDERYGEGVVALVSFAPGDIVFAFSGFFSDKVTQFSLQISRNLHLHDPYFYGKILHSCDPNTHVDVRKRRFVACKPILPGDAVTMDYAQTEDVLFRTFPCSCGADRCRGVVSGRKQLHAPVVTELSPMVAHTRTS